MKARIDFDLSKEEDQKSHDVFMQSQKMYSCLVGIIHELSEEAERISSSDSARAAHYLEVLNMIKDSCEVLCIDTKIYD